MYVLWCLFVWVMPLTYFFCDVTGALHYSSKLMGFTWKRYTFSSRPSENNWKKKCLRACVLCRLVWPLYRLFCAECPQGMYGFECGQTCQCDNGAACDHVTGACTCTPGWQGALCNQGKAFDACDYCRRENFVLVGTGHKLARAGSAYSIKLVSPAFCDSNKLEYSRILRAHYFSILDKTRKPGVLWLEHATILSNTRVNYFQKLDKTRKLGVLWLEHARILWNIRCPLLPKTR